MCPDKVTEQLGHHRASQGIGDEKGHVNFAARKRRLQKLGVKPHPQPLSKRRGEVVTIRVNNVLTCQLVNSSTCLLVNRGVMMGTPIFNPKLQTNRIIYRYMISCRERAQKTVLGWSR